jgi:excisionase family DNA binding protein
VSHTLLLTIKEVALELQISEKTVSRLVQKGEIPSLRIGRSIRIPTDQFKDWVQARTRYNLECVGTMCASAGEKPCQSLNVVMEEVKTTTSMSKDHLEKRLNDLLEPVTND